MARSPDRSDSPAPLRGSSGTGLWIGLNATAFLASACIMVVEVLSTRLVARYLGSSLYTWSSAIGVVLAGIAIGNYVGGRLADRHAPRRTLSLLFVGASLLCATIPTQNAWVGQAELLRQLAWPTRVFLHFLIVFLAPSALLGTMSPVVAKLALDLGYGSGRTIGTIYAWGSIGSIVGTLSAGFFLVAWAGTEASILLVALVLAAMGIVYGAASRVPYVAGAALLVLAALVGGGTPWSGRIASALGYMDPDSEIAEFLADSQYQRVRVLSTGPGIRALLLDTLVHSRINLGDPLDLQYEYAALYAEVIRAAHPDGAPMRALFIGGGGLAFPRYVEVAYPGSTIEATEIDPVVTEAAFQALGVPRSTSIEVYDMDARNRVSELVEPSSRDPDRPRFDFVFGDAFSDLSVPFHLTTLEFLQDVDRVLDDGGVYLMNLVDAPDSAQFLGAVVETASEVFPFVRVVSFVDDTGPSRTTFVVVAAKRDLDLSALPDQVRRRHGLRARVETPDVYPGILLTDDYAPVENLMQSVVRQYSALHADEERLTKEMAALFRREAFDEIIERGRATLETTPDDARALFWLGAALARKGDLEAATEPLAAAVALDPTNADAWGDLGITYERLDRYDDAISAYREAVAVRPRRVQTRCNLAALLARTGDAAGAEREYRSLLRNRPGAVRAHVELARLYLAQGHPEPALRSFEAAWALDPGYAGLERDYGVALLESGQAERAVPMLQAAVDREPRVARLHNELGRARASAGDPTSAALSFRRAAELAPSRGDYQANLGLSLQEQGRDREAAEAYREALRLRPEQLAVMNTLAQLLATSADPDVRDGTEALQWAEELRAAAGDRPEVRRTLELARSARAESGAAADVAPVGPE